MPKKCCPLFLLLVICFTKLMAADFPVLDNGRFVPFSAYAAKEKGAEALWQNHFFHSKPILALPARAKSGEWLSLDKLKNRESYNFTPYSQKKFAAIHTAYLAWEENVQKSGRVDLTNSAYARLSDALLDGYAEIAGKPYRLVYQKSLLYPTMRQLKAESLYYRMPWIGTIVFCYGCSLLLLFTSSYLPRLRVAALSLFGIALLLHTCMLAMRTYILNRPPVSNMFETTLYVPWIAVALGLGLYLWRKQTLLLYAGAIAAILILMVQAFAGINQSMENVQAVLDSQFWLIIHVLMIVASYGVFIYAGILGHFYLGNLMMQKVETSAMKQLSQCILHSIYLGVCLLIPGTILGGIWAAQSWGRFWDWDPKESWAFISCCFYLACIHAHYFGKIASYGIAICSVAGLLFISFTWYGVNYILGTGLHSYGFGSGGTEYYYLYAALEVAFISLALARTPKLKKNGNT